MHVRNHLAAAMFAVCSFVAPMALAQTPATGVQTFEIRPGGMSRVTFTSDAPLETIDGVSTNTTGTFTVDLAHPTQGLHGEVQITTASLTTGSTMRDEHLRSANWLDAEHNPNITFTLASVTLPGPLAAHHAITGNLQGELTVHGQHHHITVPVTLEYVPLTPDMAAMAQFGVNADMIRIQTEFHIEDRKSVV